MVSHRWVENEPDDEENSKAKALIEWAAWFTEWRNSGTVTSQVR